MRLVLLLLTVILFLSSCNAIQLNSKNIIIVLSDDLGYDDISPYNSQITYTPNLQWLADNGTVLTEFYTPVSVCTPTRAALLTGHHPAYLEGDGLLRVILPRAARPGLDIGNQSLAGQLRQKGYRTGIVGKWHLGNVGPLANGFDYAYWLLYGLSPNGDLYENDTLLETHPDYATINAQFFERAKKFISEDDGPFFLYIPHIWPHTPLLNGITPGLDYYQSAVSELDDLVGDLIDYLRQTGQLDNTIIVFASDNGPNQPRRIDSNGLPVVGWNEFNRLENQGIYPYATNPKRWIGGQHPFRQAEYNDNGELILRTGKGDVYEGGIRVPFIAYGLPLKDGPMSMVDVYDWLLTGKQPERDTFHFYNSKGNYGAIRQGDWKLHFDADFQPGALYDLTTDVGETVDLAESYPEMVAELARQAKLFDLQARGQKIYLPLVFRQ